MRLIGSAYHSPDYICVQLKKHGVGPSSFSFLRPGNKLPKKSSKTHFVFLGTHAVRSNLGTLNSKRYVGKIGIVCDSPIELCAFKGIVPLDYSESDDVHVDGFTLDELDLKTFEGPDIRVAYEPRDLVQDVVEKVQSFTGILTSLMTFVYTLPSATHQKPVKELACAWLCGTDNENVLKDRIVRLRECPMSDKQKQRLLDILLSEPATVYKRALAEARKIDSLDGDDFGRVVSKYEVSAYEMRYILSVHRAAAKR